MGNWHSGRWNDYTRKRTVEECHVADINAYRRAKANQRYAFRPPGVELALVRQARGRRYYFLCPGCGRKCAKLYAPQGSRRYLCRGCHDLTYVSAQDRRKPPRSIAALVALVEQAERNARRFRYRGK